jgi:hypothetical protein
VKSDDLKWTFSELADLSEFTMEKDLQEPVHYDLVFIYKFLGS